MEIRASQINGCAVCLHMHTEEALRSGESPMRLYMLDAWRESPLYTAREKAALGWTEALTRLSETRAPDEDYAALKAQFTKEEQVVLTLLIGVINSFNKLGVGFRVSHPAAGRKAGGVTPIGTPAEAAAEFDPLRPRLCGSPTACSGRSLMPKMWCRRPSSPGTGPIRAAVRVPEAFLRRVVVRLCLDELKSARVRRETYVGTWLPEPLVETERRDRRHHPAADDGARAALSARARRVPDARRLRCRLRRGLRDDRAGRSVMSSAGAAGARAPEGGAAAL